MVQPIDSDKVTLGDEDAAIVFRGEEVGVEIYIPDGSKNNGKTASSSVILAACLAYAVSTDNPKIVKAMRLIIDEGTKSMEEFGKKKK